MAFQQISDERGEAPIDPQNLLREIGGDHEIFIQLVKTAQRDLPNQIAQLKVAAGERNFSDVEHLAHTLKTTLAHWEARRAHEIALEIELLCRQEQPAEAVLLVPEFEQSIQAVLHALATVKVVP